MSANMIMDDAYYRFRETGGLHLESGGPVLVWDITKTYCFCFTENKPFLSLHSLLFFRKIGLLASNERFLCLSGYWRVSQGS